MVGGTGSPKIPGPPDGPLIPRLLVIALFVVIVAAFITSYIVNLLHPDRPIPAIVQELMGIAAGSTLGLAVLQRTKRR